MGQRKFCRFLRSIYWIYQYYSPLPIICALCLHGLWLSYFLCSFAIILTSVATTLGHEMLPAPLTTLIKTCLQKCFPVKFYLQYCLCTLQIFSNLLPFYPLSFSIAGPSFSRINTGTASIL